MLLLFIDIYKLFFIYKFVKVRWGAVIFAWLVRVRASRDTSR